MNTVWHKHFFVPGGDQDRERVDAVEYEDGSICVIDIRTGARIECYSRDFAMAVARKFAVKP